jgi:hypothetical protein
VPFPDGYTGQGLRRSDIPLLIEFIKKWDQDVVVGAARCHLTSEFYETECSCRLRFEQLMAIVPTVL